MALSCHNHPSRHKVCSQQCKSETQVDLEVATRIIQLGALPVRASERASTFRDRPNLGRPIESSCSARGGGSGDCVASTIAATACFAAGDLPIATRSLKRQQQRLKREVGKQNESEQSN